MSGKMGLESAAGTDLQYPARMARPLRIEFEGALYRMMARGNARDDIFLSGYGARAASGKRRVTAGNSGRW